MTPAEKQRRELLGGDVIAHIEAGAEAAPPPSADVIESLRRILTQPLGVAPMEPEAAADAA